MAAERAHNLLLAALCRDQERRCAVVRLQVDLCPSVLEERLHDLLVSRLRRDRKRRATSIVLRIDVDQWVREKAPDVDVMPK